ncbi:MAG: recombination regulator RecX [Firmicutes bacterium]|nr:recombination regulator RecX [Bacillota bacterium]
MKITALQQQEKHPWRTSIFLDGRFWKAYDTDIIAELGLHEGQRFTLEELDQLINSLEKRRAVDRAVLLLSYRSRSVHEVSSRLKKAGFAPNIIEEAIGKLKDLGYLNDDNFARAWMNGRMSSNLYGKRRIKQELRLKGVPDEIISSAFEESLSEEDEYARAKELAETKLPSYKGIDKNVIYRRLSQFLLRRGYSSSVVYDVCKDIIRNEGLE